MNVYEKWVFDRKVDVVKKGLCFFNGREVACEKNFTNIIVC